MEWIEQKPENLNKKKRHIVAQNIIDFDNKSHGDVINFDLGISQLKLTTAIGKPIGSS